VVSIAIYYFESKYYYYDGTNSYKDEKLFIPEGVKSVIGYDCQLVVNARILDIQTLEKVIFYHKSNTLRSLFQKYLHKTIGPKYKPENYPKHIYEVFYKQIKIIKSMKLETVINMESLFHSYLNRINAHEFPVNTELIKKKYVELEKKMVELKNPFPSKTSLTKYLDKKKYNYFDIDSGQEDLSFNNLRSFKDEAIDKYVLFSLLRSDRIMIQPYIGDYIPINHKPYSSITGRVHTYAPNIQALSSDYYDGNIMSFDYVSQEIMIYMHIFKPPIFYVFRESEYSDFYEFLYCYVSKVKYQPGEMNEKHKAKRDKMKITVLSMMNGMGIDGLAFKIKVSPLSLYNLYKNIDDLCEFTKNRNELINVAIKEGYYWTCRYLGQYMKDELLDGYQRIRSKANNFWKIPKHERDTEERGVIMEAMDKHKILSRKVIGLNVQRTASVILKLAVINLGKDRTFPLNAIKCLRHDEILTVDLDEVATQCVVDAMKAAHYAVLGEHISVSVKNI
jgi:hypothetical protein